jgi:hypothetical protein
MIRSPDGATQHPGWNKRHARSRVSLTLNPSYGESTPGRRTKVPGQDLWAMTKTRSAVAERFKSSPLIAANDLFSCTECARRHSFLQLF